MSAVGQPVINLADVGDFPNFKSNQLNLEIVNKN